ncbi:MAG: FAD-dependent oxidoreductase [Bacteroidales bacterium]|nr:FAD-dependent oxidoreductase [Bacteroidales bacterium]MBN2756430.1 FAD-dependent oxidoreductase [Bacteroidales bacterium]
MQKNIQLILSPEEASIETEYKNYIAKDLNIEENRITFFEVVKKSIDARKSVKIVVEFFVVFDEIPPTKELFNPNYQSVANKKEVLIVGSGPAGLFAALRLIELGFKPVIIERGKDVRNRRFDIAAINRKHIVNPDSNYCFGEGGAGTFSDGKLYTRSKKRGNVKKILEVLKYHGAVEKILIEAHPHIGTNKLPGIIKNIRETILNAGGEIHFNTKLIDIELVDNKISKAITSNGDKINVGDIILATGHSARDIYYLLHEKNILLEQKTFAMGVRVEHPQNLIDSIQYNCDIRSEHLPAASYSLVSQVNERGVYSFCMCPGGFIVPSATEVNQVVVNGMSPSSRNSKFANSGMVVEIREEDTLQYKEYGALAGLKFQEHFENLAFLNGGKGQTAPAQRLHDFVNSKLSYDLPDTSYHPGIVSSPLHFWMPENISKRLQEGFKIFGKKMKGYLTNEAVIIGVESRSSSPVRIPRDKEMLNHPQISNLYPSGEGAGFAGGIVSSAIDGERCAEKIAEKYN